MKKLLIASAESVLGGRALSGVAEVVDSLANSLTDRYQVTVVCPDGDSSFLKLAEKIEQRKGYRFCRMLGVDYCLVADGQQRLTRVAGIIAEMSPDIFHNFDAPELLSHLTVRPARALYTIDQAKYVEGKESALSAYDALTTVSETYARMLLARRDALGAALGTMAFSGVTNGILTPVFSPERGLLVAAKYSAENILGKAVCKDRLLRTYGIPGNPCLYLMMCRLVAEKGVGQAIAAAHTIRDSGGFLLVVGRGEKDYEDQLRTLRRDDGVLWLERWASPMQAAPLLSGADFYLCPSTDEPCGLMPMTACRYAAVPVVTLNGGLSDNFDDEIAVIIDDNGLEDAISRAAALYKNKAAFAAKRQACMRRDFSWTTRREAYIKLYEEG